MGQMWLLHRTAGINTPAHIAAKHFGRQLYILGTTAAANVYNTATLYAI
jgi:hypothetical protein